MATVSIVCEEVKFTLVMRSLGGYIPRSVLVEQLHKLVNEYVSLGTVHADVVKLGIGVIQAVEEAGVPNSYGNRRMIELND